MSPLLLDGRGRAVFLSSAIAMLGASSPGYAEAPDQALAPRFEVVDQVGGSVEAVALDGSRLYVGRGTRVVVMDATDPLAPTELGVTEQLPGPVLDLVVQGDTVYAATGGLVGARSRSTRNPFRFGWTATGSWRTTATG